MADDNEIQFIANSSGRRWPLLAYRGYLYLHNRATLQTSYWRCVNATKKERCNVRLTVKGDLNGDPKDLTVANLPLKDHVCGEPNSSVEQICAEMKLTAANDATVKISDIYDKTLEGLPEEVVKRLPERETVEGSLRRVRQRVAAARPKYPTINLTQLPVEKPYYVPSFSGRPLLAFHGYLYRQDAAYKDKLHWRCINYHKQLHCPSTLITTGSPEDPENLVITNLKKIKYHICGRPNVRARVLYHEVAELAMSVADDEKSSLVKIYNEVLGGEPPEVLQQLPKRDSILEYMRKMRSKGRQARTDAAVTRTTAEAHEDADAL
ncbi:hypothetical protein FOZ61_005767 [Perkinsus olseni]|uniref:FLYWCH-type domain-containing protein n=2 Tax=Perkinsus olseni TaxID=32597 RepID=A0A7J6LG10_PEROL|nr:hypothetical protein FOZ61_005767 [Perkinsus olseni]KAF4662414.1 hypothetical protein FOL46_005319 [Perkinsus olseni]